MNFQANEPGPRYNASDAAQLIAGTNDDLAHVVNQLRRLAQKGEVEARGTSGSGRTAGNLYALSDIAVARIQRALVHLGLSDGEISREAHFGCYRGSHRTTENPNGHPITDALVAHKGPHFPGDWVFQIDFTGLDAEGNRQIKATIFDQSKTANGYHPARAAMIQIPLRPWLGTLAKLLDPVT